MIDSLGTLIDEMAEAVEMLRTYYPEESETDLRQRAAALRAHGQIFFARHEISG
jgi:hypothetical protein